MGRHKGIIYLDHESVLMSDDSLGEESVFTLYKGEQHFHCRFDNECVAILNRLIDLTHAGLVLTNAGATDEFVNVWHANYMFVLQGVRGNVVGITPRSKYLETRGEEIAAWHVRRPYKHCVVLEGEDIVDIDEMPPFGDRTVLIDGHDGVRDSHAQEALDLYLIEEEVDALSTWDECRSRVDDDRTLLAEWSHLMGFA